MALVSRLRQAFEIGEHSLALVSKHEEEAEGFVIERLGFVNGFGETVRGILTRPVGEGCWPGILCIHAHGGRYDIGADEMLYGRKALLGPLGPVFAKAGYVSVMIDMPAFGVRANPDESARAKARLWLGKSLAGQMLGEQHAALAWLSQRSDVKAGQVGVFGISMGATLGYWLAAVETGIACAAHLCCYADFGELVRTGAHDLHGIYLTIPGLLAVAPNGAIAGCIAPRPQLIGIGDLDPLTPPQAVDLALMQTRQSYRECGADGRLLLVREANSGHVETPAMRQAVMAFFRDHLATG